MLKFSAADDANSHDASFNETREAQVGSRAAQGLRTRLTPTIQEADLLEAYSTALEQQANGQVNEACEDLMKLDTTISATNWESELISNLKYTVPQP